MDIQLNAADLLQMDICDGHSRGHSFKDPVRIVKETKRLRMISDDWRSSDDLDHPLNLFMRIIIIIICSP